MISIKFLLIRLRKSYYHGQKFIILNFSVNKVLNHEVLAHCQNQRLHETSFKNIFTEQSTISAHKVAKIQLLGQKFIITKF